MRRTASAHPPVGAAGTVCTNPLLLLFYGGTSYQKQRQENLQVNLQLAKARELCTAPAPVREESTSSSDRPCRLLITSKWEKASTPGRGAERGIKRRGEAEYGMATKTLETALLLSPSSRRGAHPAQHGERALGRKEP